MKTIGPGWSDDPIEREQQIRDQERLVDEIAEIMELIPEWELEAYAEEQRRKREATS